MRRLAPLEKTLPLHHSNRGFSRFHATPLFSAHYLDSYSVRREHFHNIPNAYAYCYVCYVLHTLNTAQLKNSGSSANANTHIMIWMLSSAMGGSPCFHVSSEQPGGGQMRSNLVRNWKVIANSSKLTQIPLGTMQNQICLQNCRQNTVPDWPQRVEVQFSSSLEAILLLLLFGPKRGTCTAGRCYHTVAQTRIQADALFGRRCTGHIEQRTILFAQATAGAAACGARIAAAARCVVGHVVVVLVTDQWSSYGHRFLCVNGLGFFFCLGCIGCCVFCAIELFKTGGNLLPLAKLLLANIDGRVNSIEIKSQTNKRPYAYVWDW